MSLTNAQRELLEDKYVLWERASRQGPTDLRDYNARAAEALKAALCIVAALSSEAPPIISSEASSGSLPPDAKNPSLERAAVVPAAEQGGGWRPIESAPRDGTKLLTYNRRLSPEAALRVCWWAEYYRDEAGWMDDFDSEPEPTHWQPLPLPPPDHDAIPSAEGGSAQSQPYADASRAPRDAQHEDGRGQP